jgi:hypothetical protein|tara:strand:+ start:479 stop:778 length:300 start_codon:yes stop_codon:yes gene_type:complete
MNMPKKNTHTAKSKRYAFAHKEGEDFSCIKILEGKFKDVIFHYGKVGFAKDENPDGTLPMKFDYTVRQNPGELDLDNNKEFINYIGDLLIELLDEKFKK